VNCKGPGGGNPTYYTVSSSKVKALKTPVDEDTYRSFRVLFKDSIKSNPI